MISVVLPTYNRAQLLPRAIRSVLSQTTRDLELIVVDDCSTDGTETVVRALKDDRVRYMRSPGNLGPAGARNLGIRAAAGAYIAFQDSDDAWRPEKLEKQLSALKSTEADVLFSAVCRHRDGRADEIFPRKEIKPGPVAYEELLFENLACAPTLLARAEILKAHPFDETLRALEDWALMLELSRQSRVYYDGACVMDVYEQAGSVSGDRSSLLLATHRLYQRHFQAINRQLPAARQWCLSMLLYAQGTNRLPFPDDILHLLPDFALREGALPKRYTLYTRPRTTPLLLARLISPSPTPILLTRDMDRFLLPRYGVDPRVFLLPEQFLPKK